MKNDFKVTHFLFFYGGGGAYIFIHKINSIPIAFFITETKRGCVNPASRQSKAIFDSHQYIKFK